MAALGDPHFREKHVTRGLETVTSRRAVAASQPVPGPTPGEARRGGWGGRRPRGLSGEAALPRASSGLCLPPTAPGQLRGLPRRGHLSHVTF